MENEYLKLKISEKGAELSSIIIKSKDHELIWHADQNIWARHAPVLFPVVGKLAGDTYFIDGKVYKLNQHGFARDLIHQKIGEGHYELLSTNETKSMYPYDFALNTKYQLDKNTVIINYEVKNISQEIMPFSIGANPGFNIKNRNLIKIEFEKKEEGFYLLSNGLVDFSKMYQAKNILDLKPDSFKNDALIFKNLKSSWVKLYDGDNSNELILTMHFSNLPYFGVWSKVESEILFLCLEPWWGVADVSNVNRDFFQKEGVNILCPNESMSFEYRLEINI